MSAELALRWGRLAGPVYGTESRSLFFYGLFRMIRPKRVLELGTGLGASAFLIAQAMEENGLGHLWSVDNGEQWSWASHQNLPERFGAEPVFSDLKAMQPSPLVLDEVARILGLKHRVTLLNGEVGLVDTEPVDAERYPFLKEALLAPLDVIFADINARPESCLLTLRKYLPLMSDAGSIFFDSASTSLQSYLTLEATVDQLNRGKLPAFMLAGTTRAERARLFELVATRRFSVTHLTEPSTASQQNSMAWFRFEPVNIVPYPLAGMRGFLERAEDAIAGTDLKAYLRTREEVDASEPDPSKNRADPAP